MQVEKILQEDEFQPLRFASRKFYRKNNQIYQPVGIGKCIEKHRLPYIVILRPLLPIAVGSLDMRYPNWWLAVGVAERFCSKEKIKQHTLAPDLPPLILKLQTLRKINSSFTKALKEESENDFLLGRLYKVSVGLKLVVKTERLNETLHKRVNMKKLFRFLSEIKERSFELPESEGLVITQQELDDAYKQVFSEEIQKWQELKKKQAEQVEQTIETANEEKIEEINSFSEIYKKYEELEQKLKSIKDEDISDTDISYSEYESMYNDDDDDISKHLEI